MKHVLSDEQLSRILRRSERERSIRRTADRIGDGLTLVARYFLIAVAAVAVVVWLALIAAVTR